MLEEVRLADPPLLELVQGVLALARLDPRHRLAELLERDAGVVLDRGEGLDQRRGQHAAEVGDDGGRCAVCRRPAQRQTSSCRGRRALDRAAKHGRGAAAVADRFSPQPGARRAHRRRRVLARATARGPRAVAGRRRRTGSRAAPRRS